MTTGCFLTVKYPLGKSSIPSKGALAVVIRVITEIPTHCSPPVGAGLAISYKMGPLCNWWEDRCNDGNWQRETTGRVSGEDRKLSQKEAEEINRRCCLGASWLPQLERESLRWRILVRMQCLSTAESLQCLMSGVKAVLFGTPRVGWQISYIFWWALTSTSIFVLFSTWAE